MDPLISIIVPVYKTEPYIRRCLDSLRKQTYNNIEIVLVDDGSPDNAPKICDAYCKADSRFRVIHKVNGGLSSARNCGLSASSGEFITFVDSDDYVKENYVEYLYGLLRHSNCLIGTAGHFVVRNDKNVLGGENEIIREDVKTIPFSSYRFNEKYSQICVWSMIFSRKLVQDSPLTFYVDMIRCDDFTFLAELMRRAGKVVSSNIPIYYYTLENPNALTKSPRADKLVTTFSVWLPRMRQILYKEYKETFRSVYDWVPVNYVAMMNACCDSGVLRGKVFWKAKSLLWRDCYTLLKFGGVR